MVRGRIARIPEDVKLSASSGIKLLHAHGTVPQIRFPPDADFAKKVIDTFRCTRKGARENFRMCQNKRLLSRNRVFGKGNE